MRENKRGTKAPSLAMIIWSNIVRQQYLKGLDDDQLSALLGITTFSPHCQELSRHKRSVTCNHLFRSKRNRAHQKSSHFPEVNATFAPYICVYF